MKKKLFFFFAIFISVVESSSWSSGRSTRIQDMNEELAAAQLQDLVADKEHIQEDLEDLYSEREINRMSDDELAFMYFSAHDGNDDEALDGLELYKAMTHVHGEPEQLILPGVETIETPETVEMIDILLKNYDSNDDGLLDFPEFMSSFSSNKDKLNL